MRWVIAAVLLCVSVPVTAETAFPISVPTECVQLAEREHVPTVIENKYQALKANYKLAHLSSADPQVAQCKEAVNRLKAAKS